MPNTQALTPSLSQVQRMVDFWCGADSLSAEPPGGSRFGVPSYDMLAIAFAVVSARLVAFFFATVTLDVSPVLIASSSRVFGFARPEHPGKASFDHECGAMRSSARSALCSWRRRFAFRLCSAATSTILYRSSRGDAAGVW